jgi:uncharacterized protein (DUF1778 family)
MCLARDDSNSRPQLSVAKRERLQARLSEAQKELLQRAADLEGQSLSGFVIQSALHHAEQVIRAREVIQLSARDSRVFVEALLNPPALSRRMRSLAARYRRDVEEL